MILDQSHAHAEPSRQRSEVVGELYERYRFALRQFFVSRGRAGEADDLVQQIFLELTRTPPPMDLRDAESYLFGVAWNRLRDLRRRERREPAEVQVSDDLLLDEENRRFGALCIEDDLTTLI